MAKQINDNFNLDWNFSFERKDAFPIDRSSVFTSLEDAKKYAKGEDDSRFLSGTSYVGQIISVVENNTVNVYKIVNIDGNLELIGTQADWEATDGVAAIRNKPNMRSGVDLSGNIDNTTIVLAGNDNSQAYVQNGIAVGPGSVAGGFAFLVKEVGQYTNSQFVSKTAQNESINAFKLITSADNGSIIINTILKGDNAGKSWSGNGRVVTFQWFDWANATKPAADEPFSFQTTRWSPTYTTVKEVVVRGTEVIIVFNDSYKLNSTDAKLIQSSGGLSSSGWCCWFPQRPTYGTVRITDIDEQWSPPENLTCIALGVSAKARATGAIAIGRNVLADGPYSLALTKGATAQGQYAIAASESAVANGEYAVAIGQSASASATGAIALGRMTSAQGNGAVALGQSTTAIGSGSLAFGYKSIANSAYSVAGGTQSQAAYCSFAFGDQAKTTGSHSFAFGNQTQAWSAYSFAFGKSSTAQKEGSFAFGLGSQANGRYSLAFGQGIHTTNSYEIAFGCYNYSEEGTTLFSIGNGNGLESSRNLFQINQDGTVYIASLGSSALDTTSLQEHISNLYSMGESLGEFNSRIDELEGRIVALEAKLNS